jgi:hypothetical protein
MFSCRQTSYITPVWESIGPILLPLLHISAAQFIPKEDERFVASDFLCVLFGTRLQMIG